MTADYRAMCAELAQEVEQLWSIVRDDNNEPHPLANRARALLDQPVAEGPTDEELLESAAKALGYKSIPSDETCLTAEAGELLDYARAVLARFGRPTPQPPADDEVAELVAWGGCGHDRLDLGRRRRFLLPGQVLAPRQRPTHPEADQ